MENHTYKWIGALLMIAGGLIYTVERCAALISYAIMKSGNSVSGTNIDIKPEYPGFFENFFVWFFLFVGFLILAYGFPKK